MRVTVKTHNGVTVDIDVPDANITVKTFKTKIYNQGTIRNAMRLSYDGTHLHDDKTLVSYGIKGGTVQAQTEPERDINILVDIPIKGRISKRIKNIATVEELVEQVNKEHHVYRKGERLRLLFETTELKLTMPLHHYNIKDCSVLEIQRSCICLLIEDNHGDVLYHRIDRHKLVKELKNEISEYDGHIPTPEIASFVLSATGPTSFNGTVKDLYKGAKRCNVKAMRLYIKTGSEYTELVDDQELDYYKLRDNSMLFLVVYRWAKPFELRRQNPPYEDVIVYGVEPEQDTILSLKLRLQEQHGIPVSQKALCLSRKEEHGPSPVDAHATFVYEYAVPFCIL